MSLERSDSLILPGSWSEARGALSRWGCLAAYLVLGALTLSPLLWARVPPFVDYPNHLARMWILLHDRDIPALASNYIVDWRLLPDLAMDLVVPALAQFMPLEVAGRVFIALTMASLALGTAALHRALHGRIGLWPLVSLLFIYNSVLYWGFLNFLFTLGFALLAFAGWVASARWSPGWRAVAFAPLAAMLFVCHLFGLGIYGLLVAGYEFGRLSDERRWTVAGLRRAAIHLAQFIPAAVLWAVSLRHLHPGYTAYNNLAFKWVAAIAPATFGWLPTALDCAVLLLAINFLCYAKARRVLSIAPAMRRPLLLMLVAALLMPNWLYGSWSADLRLPVALAFVLVASLRFTEAGPQRRAVGAFAAAALLLLGVRLWAVSESWRDADRRFTEFRTAARALPEGARLLVVREDMTDGAARIDGVPDWLARREMMMFWNLPALAVIDRNAFLPYLFTFTTPILFTPHNTAVRQMYGRLLLPSDLIASAAGRPLPAPVWPYRAAKTPTWIDWAKEFDFVVWLDFGSSRGPVPANLEAWAAGSFFEIYRIKK